MEIINLTPHAINVVDKETKKILITFPKSENPARLPAKTVVLDKMKVEGIVIPISTTEFNYEEATNLPKYIIGMFYIVSRMILSAFPDRNDLLVPNELVRDDAGNIIGCASLAIS